MTMTTQQLTALLQEQFAKMTEGVNTLFEMNVDKEDLWNNYLDSFPAGTNEIYRERREFDCNSCKQFIRLLGRIAVLKEGKVITLWDIEINDPVFTPVVESMRHFVATASVKGVFSVEPKFSQAGMPFSKCMLEDGTVETFNHLHIKLPKKFINHSRNSDASIKGEAQTTKQVFKRSLDELTMDSLDTVLELIGQKSLYKGEEWENVLELFRAYKQAYDKLGSDAEKDLFAWEYSVQAGVGVTRLRNHSMGTLLVDISNEVDLNTAVLSYRKIVDPLNYKRSKSVFTAKQAEDAKQTVKELGYEESLSRRFATIEDVSVNDIIFSNRDEAKKMKDVLSVFDDLSATVATKPKKFDHVEEVSIETFLSDIVPTATSLEVFVENKHKENFVSLVAPSVEDAKSMFKWENGFSWGYAGNVTDSLLKENVKSAGGKVDGVLRFSIQWNDIERDGNDLDAHCIEPRGNEIYFGSRSNYRTGGTLDVDIQNPRGNNPAVENITWAEKSKMEQGKYAFYVKNFSNRGGVRGFRAEIEFDGQVFSFNYDKPLRNKESVHVADVVLNADGTFTMNEKVDSSQSSVAVWNVQTNNFAPVTVMMLSPNHWESGNKTGHKHFMFMLKDCLNPDRVNSFFNEFLNEELYPQHRKVFEILGSKLAVPESDKQLSGLGFSSTKRAEVLIKVIGSTERVVKVKF